MRGWRATRALSGFLGLFVFAPPSFSQTTGLGSKQHGHPARLPSLCRHLCAHGWQRGTLTLWTAAGLCPQAPGQPWGDGQMHVFRSLLSSRSCGAALSQKGALSARLPSPSSSWTGGGVASRGCRAGLLRVVESGLGTLVAGASGQGHQSHLGSLKIIVQACGR